MRLATSALLLVIPGFSVLLAQNLNQQSGLEQIPQRGPIPGYSYNIGEFENISTANGGVSLKIPIVTLPADRGDGGAATLDLLYNSKLWDVSTRVQTDPTQPPPPSGCTDPVNTYSLTPGDHGGWSYGFEYELWLTNRNDHYAASDGCALSCTQPAFSPSTVTDVFRYQLVFPDGSIHDLIPIGNFDTPGDGYYNVLPTGLTQACAGTNGASLTITGSSSPLAFYTIDGTYARLQLAPPPDCSTGPGGPDCSTDTGLITRPWTLYFKDGRTVTNNADGSQSIVSRNNVVTTISSVDQTLSNGDDQLVATITDSVGRTITRTSTTSNGLRSDSITVTGYAPPGTHTALPTLTWTVSWSILNSSVQYQPYDTFPGSQPPPNTFPGQWVVTHIQYPPQSGGLGYSFNYGETSEDTSPLLTAYSGELHSVQMTPGGAQVSYTYSGDPVRNQVFPYHAYIENTVSTKTLTHDGQTDSWTYSFAPPQGGTITAPDGGVTTETLNYWGYPVKTKYPDSSELDRVWQQNIPLPNGGGQPPVASPTPTGYGSLSSPLYNPFVGAEFHVLAGDQNAPTAITSTDEDLNGNITSKKEYDFIARSSLLFDSNGYPNGIPMGPTGATLRRTTAEGYQVALGYYDIPSSPSSNLLDLLKSKQVSGDGPGARTEYCYDGRGNISTYARWDSNQGGSSNSQLLDSQCKVAGPAIVFLYSYDGYGNLTQATDPMSNVTQYTYGSVGSTGGLYPTTITYADNETVSRAYDFWTGVATSATDSNGVETTFSYCTYASLQDTCVPDVFMRPSMVQTVDRTTTYEYSDIPSTHYVITRTDQSATGDAALTSVKRFDQLGRESETQQLEAADSAIETDPIAGIRILSNYFAGPVNYRVSSNPFRSDSDPTTGWTCTQFDRMGRPEYSQVFAGSSPPDSCTGSGGFGTAVTDYSAENVTTTDEAGVKRTVQKDALGRVVQVTEDPAGSQLVTTYTYDALDNLTSATQTSQNPRTFTYDSLGRLLSATNLENGTICYGTWSQDQCVSGYDKNGNLLSKTDARKVVTTYSYDNRNRLTSKSYQVPSGVAATPSVAYCYGQPTAAQGCPQGVPNATGRLTSVTSSAATTMFNSYNIHGEVMSVTATVGGMQYSPFGYTYDLAGHLASIQYPSGRKVSYTFDGAGRTATVADATIQYTSSTNAIAYTPQGAISTITFGDNLVETWQYNGKLQPTSMQAGSLLTLGYGYSATANNGNVLSQTITAAGQPTFLQRYQYDSLNRLCLATENQVDFPTLPCQAPNSAGWSAVFTYDQYGNRAETATYTLGADAATALPQYDTNTNRLTWQPDGKTPIPNLTYDAAGNQTGDPGPPSATMQYDAEGRMTQEISGGNVATYTYDGDGRRVSKSVTGSTTATTTYLYDTAGQLAAEYSSLAPADSGITYLTGDHLGSTRLVTSGAGALHRSDYGPFGEDLAGLGLRSGLVTDGSPGGEPLKFTGKERDAETGLDYFESRYFSGAQGRFTSPDPKQFPHDITDPQTWNKYSYVRNNPLVFVDPDGRDLKGVFKKTWEDIKHVGSVMADSYRFLGSVLSENKGFSFSTISYNDINNIGKNITLGVALGGLGEEGAAVGVSTEAVSTEAALTDLANEAVSNVGPGSGSTYGTLVHSEFADLVDATGNSNLSTEVSYKGGQVVPYGTKGSVRVDVAEGPIDAPTAVYDLKTGKASLTPARVKQIQAELPGGQNVPVKEIKPQQPQ